MLTPRWFISKTVRHATAMRKHVRHLINAQRDLLSPAALEALNGAANQLGNALRSGAAVAELEREMKHLEGVADKWLLRYPHHSLRENVEVFLVALAVAMGIRTFFIQPFKIPTGSMQPTLYGVTSESLLDRTDVQRPAGWGRVKEWFAGVSYVKVIAPAGGMIEAIAPPVGITILNLFQKVTIAGRTQTLWFPPDYGQESLQQRGEIQPGRVFAPGETAIHVRVKAGDHLFVDRLTYNFRKPTRGEIVVFQTSGIPADKRTDVMGRWSIPGDQFYIKRMVAMENELVRIGDDHHLIINGKRLDASTPRFENVYGAMQPAGAYLGHLPLQLFAGGQEQPVRPNHFMVMGDNTRSSLDSRYFGDVDANAIIGKSWFVYWPITDRFGLGYR
jgi:signal peptidase I